MRLDPWVMDLLNDRRAPSKEELLMLLRVYVAKHFDEVDAAMRAPVGTVQYATRPHGLDAPEFATNKLDPDGNPIMTDAEFAEHLKQPHMAGVRGAFTNQPEDKSGAKGVGDIMCKGTAKEITGYVDSVRVYYLMPIDTWTRLADRAKLALCTHYDEEMEKKEG